MNPNDMFAYATFIVFTLAMVGLLMAGRSKERAMVSTTIPRKDPPPKPKGPGTIAVKEHPDFTQCPDHGRSLTMVCFGEHTADKNEVNHFHTMYLGCTTKDCKNVVPDRMSYYGRVHPEQLQSDIESFREAGYTFLVPEYMKAPPVPEGDTYREQAPDAPEEPVVVPVPRPKKSPE